MAQGASAGGGAFKALGSIISGQAQGNALSRAAQVARQNAVVAKEAGDFNAAKSGVIADNKIGAAAANYSASGVSMQSGSVMNVLAASHANAELDRMNILHGAQIRAVNYQNQASMDDLGAANSVTSGWMNAIGSIAGAAGSFVGMSKGNKPDNSMLTAGGDEDASQDLGSDPSETAFV